MRFVFNSPTHKDLRRQLRHKQTDVELFVWQLLRDRRFQDLKFIRQYGVGRYVLDFYCPKLKLAIEIDGSQHAEREQEDYDLERTAYLNDKGIKVLRFWNNQIINEIDAVNETIFNAIKSLS